MLAGQDGTKGSAESKTSAQQGQPSQQQEPATAWEAPVNDHDGLTSSAECFNGSIPKTSSISSFPRSPSSVSRGYLSLTTVHSPSKLSCDSSSQSPKSTGFLTSRRSTRKPLLVRSEVSMPSPTYIQHIPRNVSAPNCLSSSNRLACTIPRATIPFETQYLSLSNFIVLFGMFYGMFSVPCFISCVPGPYTAIYQIYGRCREKHPQ